MDDQQGQLDITETKKGVFKLELCSSTGEILVINLPTKTETSATTLREMIGEHTLTKKKGKKK